MYGWRGNQKMRKSVLLYNVEHPLRFTFYIPFYSLYFIMYRNHFTSSWETEPSATQCAFTCVPMGRFCENDKSREKNNRSTEENWAERKGIKVTSKRNKRWFVFEKHIEYSPKQHACGLLYLLSYQRMCGGGFGSSGRQWLEKKVATATLT